MRLYDWMTRPEGIIQADRITWTKPFIWCAESMVVNQMFPSVYHFSSNRINDSDNLTGEVHLKPGTYNYEFQCMMPSDLPSSVEGSIGHIRYTACVVIDIPWWRSKEYELQFTVIKTIDLNDYPTLRVNRSLFSTSLNLKSNQCPFQFSITATSHCVEE